MSPATAVSVESAIRPFGILGAPFEPVLRGMAVLIVFWLMLLWMYRRRIFLKI